ncbi:N-6 DNA methylase [Clostridium tertium]|uniref:site-specific DNA-methyltransferase (adenine-specific) n=1 Tax=Clostridium tertium TaxID=1559 RepID=A0A6N3GIV2_9CLOT
MGRKEKVLAEKIVNEEYIDKRLVGYYSTPSFICEYIKDRLIEINSNGRMVLDPCCGREEMLIPFLKENIKSYGIDIIKYKNDYNCNFQNIDFIRFFYNKINEVSKFDGLDYDYYVLNPPYNCHEVQYIRENRDKLKSIFNDVGIHNMYGMFISAVIDLAKEGAVIGIITQDSFLTSKSYAALREKILRTCSIHEITMCPTSLFINQGADVRTSIIILQKGVNFQGNIIANNRSVNILELKDNLTKSNKMFKLEDIILDDENDNKEFIINCPKDVKELFKLSRLGSKFNCITGISTGNDKKFLSKEKTEPFTMPFYKNPGKDRFFTDKFVYINKDFLEISKASPNFIVRNKELLYKEGIICSSMGVEFTASRMPEGSTFGVNTCIVCEDDNLFWLLAYLNSSLVTYFVRGVLLRTNMITSGYVSRIPQLNFNKDEKNSLAKLGEKAYQYAIEKKDISDILTTIDKIVNNVAKISDESVKYIMEFKAELVKRT